MKTRIALLLLLTTAIASAEPLSESFGGKGELTHPGTLKVVTTGKVPRAVFDLSAIPKGAKVYHASLHVASSQPREPIEIAPATELAADARPITDGPLKLEGPYYRSFDATAAVQGWVNSPGGNLGLAAISFPGDLNKSVLWVRYDGKPAKPLPAPVEGLKVIHHDGQTFLRWKEVPAYRPPEGATLWVTHVGGKMGTANEPGKDDLGYPRIPAITLQTLRDMQGLAVRDKAVGEWSRAMAPFKRLREVPDVKYRVYRSSEKITPATVAAAELVGQTDALDIYQQSFIHILSHGEYYAPREDATSVLPTWTVGDNEPVLPGESFFVYTPQAGGKAFYAVTAVVDGVENLAAVSDANASAAVEEKASGPKPVLQWVTKNKTRYGNSEATEFWYAVWLAPPLANVPSQTPMRMVMAVPKDFAEPGPMVISARAGMGPGWKVDNIDKAYLHVEQDVSYAGDLCYHSGRGTLRSFREGRVDYYSDRYFTGVVKWVLGKWPIDRSRLTASVGTHYGIRHPELFPILWNAPYSVDYNQKWNPSRGSLDGRLGPRDISQTVDGAPAWDAFDIRWYLNQDPGKDTPFWVHDINGKESGHNVEYGWQDDAMGQSALRDARQPCVIWWGGSVSREIVDGLRKMTWTRSVPAFSNCSLDANPGNGDPADGDPWGQINGYLWWDFDSIVDEPDRWEMTVWVTADCPYEKCTVDVTPRHRKKFHPKAGEKCTWTNTSLADEKKLGGGEIVADKWGLTTLKQITITKGKNRLVIKKP